MIVIYNSNGNGLYHKTTPFLRALIVRYDPMVRCKLQCTFTIVKQCRNLRKKFFYDRPQVKSLIADNRHPDLKGLTHLDFILP